MLLGLIDPVVARQMLADVEPESHLIGSGYGNTHRKQWYEAWALADPAYGAKLCEQKLAEGLKAATFDLQQTGLLGFVEVLAAPPAEREEVVLRFFWGV